jgi:hypothetical protein
VRRLGRAPEKMNARRVDLQPLDGTELDRQLESMIEP